MIKFGAEQSASTTSAHETREVVKPVSLFSSVYSLYGLLVLYVGWFVFALITFVSSCLAGALRWVLPAATAQKFGRWGIHRVFQGYVFFLRITGVVKIDLSALDVLRGEKKLILAPNHPSLLDAVFVLSRLPDVVCIMKASLWDNIALGGGARLAGYVRNDSHVTMVRSAVKSLEQGGQLLVFPEATRTVNLPVNEFKGVTALLAKRSGASVQAIYLESNTDFLGKLWPLLKKPNFPLVYRARLGKRYTPPVDLRVFVEELQHDFVEALGPNGHRFDKREHEDFNNVTS
jgi:1-acyl-sn-glycerol-3-phosphate acyltransferase